MIHNPHNVPTEWREEKGGVLPSARQDISTALQYARSSQGGALCRVLLEIQSVQAVPSVGI